MSAKINWGKDLSYGSVELTITGEPLAYVAISAMEYQLYDLGARNSLSMHEVNDSSSRATYNLIFIYLHNEAIM